MQEFESTGRGRRAGGRGDMLVSIWCRSALLRVRENTGVRLTRTWAAWRAFAAQHCSFSHDLMPRRSCPCLITPSPFREKCSHAPWTQGEPPHLTEPLQQLSRLHAAANCLDPLQKNTEAAYGVACACGCACVRLRATPFIGGRGQVPHRQSGHQGEPYALVVTPPLPLFYSLAPHRPRALALTRHSAAYTHTYIHTHT